MSQPPLQDTAAAQCDVLDAAEAGDGGIPSEIKGVCAESCEAGRYGCPADARRAVCDRGALPPSLFPPPRRQSTASRISASVTFLPQRLSSASAVTAALFWPGAIVPTGGKGANISGTLIDAPFPYTAPGLSSAKDWAEVGGGIRLPAWSNGAVTVSVTTSITPNQTTTYVSRLGVVQAF
jgi:hypothetical protein